MNTKRILLPSWARIDRLEARNLLEQAYCAMQTDGLQRVSRAKVVAQHPWVIEEILDHRPTAIPMAFSLRQVQNKYTSLAWQLR